MKRLTQITAGLLLPLIACSLNADAKETQTLKKPQTVVPLEGRHDWWAPRHEEKLAEVKVAKPGQIDLVMIGDSITHYWEKQRGYPKSLAPHKVLNLGFGGDRTQNVLWRLQNGAVEGLSPKFVTLMIGTNNSARDRPQDIYAGITAIVKELRQRLPESQIIVFSIFPRKEGRAYETVKAVNLLLPQLAKADEKVSHHDLSSVFLDKQGALKAESYGRDLLHISAEGYAGWNAALLKIVGGKRPNKSAAASTQKKSNASSNETSSAASGTQPIIRLWPIDQVGGEQNRLKEQYRERRGGKQLCGILDPNLTVYQVKSATPTPAIVYCPGGAYKVLGLPSDADIKNWHDLGITVFVLKYTIPDNLDAAFKDVQRAVRLVRHQAKKWNVDPNMIGLFGNSAGGHLSARLTQNYNQKAYAPIDAADAVSCEPNFAILQCAAYFQGRRMDQDFDAELFHMKNKVAPTFLTYSKDDKFCKGGVEYEKRLKEAGGEIHLKLYEKGGHGMGGCDWFSEAATWLKTRNIVSQ